MANNLNSCGNLEIVAVATPTDMQVIKFQYEWKPYHLHDVTRYNMYSPVFDTPCVGSCKWEIRLDRNFEKYSLYLHSIKTNPEINAYYEFSISHPEWGRSIVKELDTIVNFKPDEWSGFVDFAVSDLESNYFNCKRIKVICEIVILIETEKSSIIKNMQVDKPKCEMIQNTAGLLYNEKFSDVKLVVNDHELSAHKNILSLHSDVFAAMFEHDMKERNTGRVDITDVKLEVLKEMLHFIYTGEAPNLVEMARDLLAAADKYALKTLKVMSEKALFNQLSSETAVEILILAHLHGADELKSKAMAFIMSHAAEIIKTEVWENAIEKYSHFIAKEFSALALSSCNHFISS